MMKKTLSVIFLKFCVFTSALFAKEELFLSMPAGGTGYLKNLLENIANYSIISPTSSSTYILDLCKYENTEDVIAIGHLFDPVVYNFIQDHVLPWVPKLIFLRDPRDVVLSAIDLIDRNGVEAWPYLPSFINNDQWKSFSFDEKIMFLVSQQRITSVKTPITLGFEHAIQLVEHGLCTVVKYEDLSIRNEDKARIVESVQKIASFLGEEIDNDEAYMLALASWGVSKNHLGNPGTFNAGNTFRYKNELNEEMQKLITKKLRKYITYFGYES